MAVKEIAAPLCVDCKHYEPVNDRNFIIHSCARKITNVVDGQGYFRDFGGCQHARTTWCGLAGIFFEKFQRALSFASHANAERVPAKPRLLASISLR